MDSIVTMEAVCSVCVCVVCVCVCVCVCVRVCVCVCVCHPHAGPTDLFLPMFTTCSSVVWHMHGQYMRSNLQTGMCIYSTLYVHAPRYEWDCLSTCTVINSLHQSIRYAELCTICRHNH